MQKHEKRKCLYCGKLFTPDARNHRTQRYCGEKDCRKASKAASQKKWLSKDENKDYFRGEANVKRVQEWRKAHPEYWKRVSRKKPEKPQEGENALQEFFNRKSRKGKGAKLHFDSFALQDSLKLQIELIVGLTSTLIGSTLQESIANAIECYHARGQDILCMGHRKS